MSSKFSRRPWYYKPSSEASDLHGSAIYMAQDMYDELAQVHIFAAKRMQSATSDTKMRNAIVGAIKSMQNVLAKTALKFNNFKPIKIPQKDLYDIAKYLFNGIQFRFKHYVPSENDVHHVEFLSGLQLFICKRAEDLLMAMITAREKSNIKEALKSEKEYWKAIEKAGF